MVKKSDRLFLITTLENKNNWSRCSSQNKMTLSNWIISILNSNFQFTILPKEHIENIQQDKVAYVSILKIKEYKNYWVHCSQSENIKLVHWAISKLNYAVKHNIKPST